VFLLKLAMLLKNVSGAQWNRIWNEFGAHLHTKPLLYLTLSMCLIVPLLGASLVFQSFDVNIWNVCLWAFGIHLNFFNPLHFCFYLCGSYYLFSVSYMISLIIVNVLFASCTTRFWLPYCLKMIESDEKYKIR